MCAVSTWKPQRKNLTIIEPGSLPALHVVNP